MSVFVVAQGASERERERERERDLCSSAGRQCPVQSTCFVFASFNNSLLVRFVENELVNLHLHMCVCMYVCMYACMYAYMYVCMCVCVCICVWFNLGLGCIESRWVIVLRYPLCPKP